MVYFTNIKVTSKWIYAHAYAESVNSSADVKVPRSGKTLYIGNLQGEYERTIIQGCKVLQKACRNLKGVFKDNESIVTRY